MQQRREDNSLRVLGNPGHLVDFASNDYLGFVADPGAPSEPLPAGSSGSRLISGNHRWYREAEEVVRDFHRAEAALIYNSGYDANLGLLSAILQRGDLIFYDQYSHASIRDGIRLGNARACKFAHNDLASLQEKAAQLLKGEARRTGTVYVVTESVFSMEGDGPDLRALADYCRQQDFRLIVDEAHAVGILGPEGRGAVVGLGLQDAVFARVVTFGKALGGHGAAVLGSTALKAYLVNFSRSLIYTTALPPASLQSILHGYHRLRGGAGEAARRALGERVRLFVALVAEKGLSGHIHPGLAAIHCCHIGGNDRVKAHAALLQQAGFDVKPILSPTVPEGRECLRFSLHAFNSEAEIREVLSILAKALKGD